MKVFVDACCFFAAFHSPRGGSALVLELARLGKLTIVTNLPVVQEACKNIKAKVGSDAVRHFHQAIRVGLIEVLGPPSADAVARWASLTHDKDTHVLAGAHASCADCLITLDRKHLLPQRVRASFPLPIRTPAEFLEAFLPGT